MAIQNLTLITSVQTINALYLLQQFGILWELKNKIGKIGEFEENSNDKR